MQVIGSDPHIKNMINSLRVVLVVGKVKFSFNMSMINDMYQIVIISPKYRQISNNLYIKFTNNYMAVLINRKTPLLFNNRTEMSS